MVNTRNNRMGKQRSTTRKYEGGPRQLARRGGSGGTDRHPRRPAEASPEYGQRRPAEASSEHGQRRTAEASSEHGQRRTAEASSEHGQRRTAEASSEHGQRRSARVSSDSGKRRDPRRTKFSPNSRRNRQTDKPTRTVGKPGQRGAKGAEEQEQGSREQEFVTGRRAVLEALKGGRSLNKILLLEGSSGGSLNEIVAVARDAGVVIQHVPKAKLDEISPERGHQGIIAYMSAKPYVEIDDLIALARARKPGLIVLLDGLEDPHNLGSVLRSVDGAGGHGVIIPKRRAVPLTGTVAQASAGALEHVEVARVVNISQALQKLKDAGFWVIGTAPDAQQPYWSVDYTVPTVLVIGGEGSGMNRLTKERCDALVALPMNGKINSLNAGVAAGILLYEAVRQRSQIAD